jgi:hypothetical protein
MKKSKFWINILFSFCCVAVISTAQATVPDGVYYIKMSNGKYLGIAGINPNNGAELIQWDFSSGDNHKFEIKNNPDGSVFIIAKHSGRYWSVDLASKDNNARIVQWDFANQDNQKFFLISNINGNGHAIQCWQSKLYLHTYGGNHITENNRGIVQYQGVGQWFYFENVNGLKVTNNDKIKINNDALKALKRTFERSRNTGDNNLHSTYYLSDPQFIVKERDYRVAKVTKRSPATSDQPRCEAENIKIRLEDNSFMTADIASQISEIVPGTAFDFSNYLNGSWKTEETSRNPITLTSSVTNIKPNGKVYQEVTTPNYSTLRQAVANLYTDFAEDPLKQTGATYQATVHQIDNKGEFQLHIGAGGHYFGLSASNSFSLKKNTQSTTLLIDITKIMFSIKASPSVDGFFSDPALNDLNTMVYIKGVDYGLRVLASVETTMTTEEIANAFNLEGDWGVAGFKVDFDLLNQNMKGETTIKMFIVGGKSQEIVSAYNLNDLKYKIQALEKSMAYHNAQPIRYQLATARENYIVNYYTATDEFKKQTCQIPLPGDPASVVTLNQFFIQKHSDSSPQLYGKVWAMAYKGNTEVPAVNGQNHLMNINGEGENYLHFDDSEVTMYNNNEKSTFTGFKQSDFGNGAKLEIFYILLEKDGCCPDWNYGEDADDEQFVFQNTNAFTSCDDNRYSPNRWCKLTIPLDKANESRIIEQVLTVDGDFITVRVSLGVTTTAN